MILYKVVNKDRKSAIVHNLKHYSLTYKKGKTISAKKGTFGIFCFETKRHALDFCDTDHSILKVKTIGNKIEVDRITYCLKTSRELKSFYNKINNPKYKIYFFSFPPEGTVCYPKVKVLT